MSQLNSSQPPDLQDALDTLDEDSARRIVHLPAELQTMLTAAGLDPQTVLMRHHNGTIAPTPDLPESQDDAAIASLRPLELGQLGTEFKLGETLGEGGMGLVRLAEQVALERDVAIKSVKPGGGTARAALALLREAWVLGRLEHPNVVPIHTLGQDSSGAPTFVMKRVEGQAWSALIADPSLLPQAAQTDPVRWHLGVLSQVCNAIAFSHSKGVLHRDLKPANVMIGPFGEVYVLDWGLAVSLDNDQERIPLAKDVKDIAGTLQYMAPEMAAAKGEQLDPRTDVYLLGALLHEVLTGAPRHDGVTPMEVLAAAWHSRQYAYGPSVPDELAAIANRATAFNREDRYSDAAEMQRAIGEFLEHESSRKVGLAAAERLVELRCALAETAPDEADVATRFAAARFGFQVALESWPDNEAATRGLDEALRLMIAFELHRGNAGAVRSLLNALTTPHTELDGQLRALEEAQAITAAQAEKLAHMQQQLDVRIGGRTRSFLAMVLGIVFGGLPAVFAYLEWQGRFVLEHGDNLRTSGAFVLTCFAGAVWARETLTKTLFNRRVTLSLFAVAIANFLVAWASYQLALAPHVMPAMSMLVCALYAAMFAVHLDHRMIASMVTYLVAFVGAIFIPEAALTWIAIGHSVACGSIAWLWRPETFVGPYSGDARKL
ncbi:MAG: serine/threonine protein kinase [Myxococcales bacterium]|nr:serine/threonine protein kinase [Myxococcales bacterium]